jgi:hypothetical protein
VAQGDILLVAISAATVSAAGEVVPAADFDVFDEANGLSYTLGGFSAWVKEAGAAEPATYDFMTPGTSSIWAGLMVAVRDAEPPATADMQAQANASSNLAPAPSVTIPAGGIAIAFWAVDASADVSMTPPTDYDEIAEALEPGGDVWVGAASYDVAGATGIVTATLNVTTQSAGAQVPLAAAAAAGGFASPPSVALLGLG